MGLLDKDEQDLLLRANAHPKDPEIRWEVGQKLLADDKFNLLLDSNLAAARQFVQTENPQQFPPLASVYGRSIDNGGKWETIVAQLTELPDNKVEVFEALGRKIFAERPDFLPITIHFTSETWVSKEGYTKEALEKGEFVPPSKASDRQEQVTIMGRTIDGRMNMAGDVIERRKDNTMQLKPKMYMPYVKLADNMESDMLHAFFGEWIDKRRANNAPLKEQLREVARKLGEELGGAEGKRLTEKLLKAIDEEKHK